MKTKCIFLILALLIFFKGISQNKVKMDKIPSKNGEIEITFIGHGSLMISFEGKNIQVDPYSKLADYSTFPKADIILITHHHGDHMDLEAINKVKTDKTVVIYTKKCDESTNKIDKAFVIGNGETKEIASISISAVPAYNIVHKRDNGDVFHPKGEGNGYVVTIDTKVIYIAGDSENIPEMGNLRNIDIAFLPANLPYTMTPAMFAQAAKSFKPGILYPYHTGNTNLQELVELLKDEKQIELRLRDMK